MKYLLKAAFAFFDILMLTLFVIIGMFNLLNGHPDRSLVFELFYLEIPFSFAIFLCLWSFIKVFNQKRRDCNNIPEFSKTFINIFRILCIMVDVWTMAMFVVMTMDELSHNTICRPYEIFLWPIIPCLFVLVSGFCYGNCMFDKIKK